MCGRFATGNLAESGWSDWLGLSEHAAWPEPSWNVAPTDTIAVVGEGKAGRSVRLARWGFIPFWWSKPLSEFRLSTINARSEDVAEKPVFRDAFRKGRCLIPAIGYYEWSGAKGAKQPWFVTLSGNQPGIVFAGLWSQTRIGEDKVLSATILTAAAGEATSAIHHRTPVMLQPDDWERWLTPESDVSDLLSAPPDARVLVRKVGKAVGNVRNDGPELIEPID